MVARKASMEKPLHWVGSSKADLIGFPAGVVDDFGYALSVVQFGGTPPSAKAWKGEGSGVQESVGIGAPGAWSTP